MKKFLTEKKNVGKNNVRIKSSDKKNSFKKNFVKKIFVVGRGGNFFFNSLIKKICLKKKLSKNFLLKGKIFLEKN